MTEEEYFRKHYPDVCYNGKPLSPYWDFFQDGVEFGERQSEKKIEELEQKLKVETELSKRLYVAYREYEQLTKEQDEHIVELEKENAELKEKSKRQSNNYKQDVDMLKERNEYKNEVCKELAHQANTLQDNLTKAKELLELFIQWNYGCCKEPDYKDLVKQAEQFIKDSEVVK